MAKLAAFRALVLGAVTAAGLALAAPHAQAAVAFRNITNRPLKFVMDCGNGQDLWRINPGASANIRCNNDAPAARVVIHTDHNGQDVVVRAVVYDGLAYRIGYDTDGDVNIFRS